MKHIAVAIACASILVGCSKGPYEKAFDEYVTGCTYSGAPEELCECSFEKVTEMIGEKEIARAYNTNSTPPRFNELLMQSVAICVSE